MAKNTAPKNTAPAGTQSFVIHNKTIVYSDVITTYSTSYSILNRHVL